MTLFGHELTAGWQRTLRSHRLFLPRKKRDFFANFDFGELPSGMSLLSGMSLRAECRPSRAFAVVQTRLDFIAQVFRRLPESRIADWKFCRIPITEPRGPNARAIQNLLFVWIFSCL